MTTTIAPTNAADTDDTKIVKIKDTEFDISTPIGILDAALAIESVNAAQRQAYDAMTLGGMPKDMIAAVLSMGLIKDLRAAIKAAKKPDHDAVWYASNIRYGAGDYTLESFVGTIRSMINAANVSMAEYNEINKETGANIRPLVLEGGSSRKRAVGEKTDRSYGRFIRAMIEHKIDRMIIKSRNAEFIVRQRNLDGGMIAYEFRGMDGTWSDSAGLYKGVCELYTRDDVSFPDIWRAVTIKASKDADPVMAGNWYDEVIKD